MPMTIHTFTRGDIVAFSHGAGRLHGPILRIVDGDDELDGPVQAHTHPRARALIEHGDGDEATTYSRALSLIEPFTPDEQ